MVGEKLVYYEFVGEESGKGGGAEFDIIAVFKQNPNEANLNITKTYSA